MRKKAPRQSYSKSSSGFLARSLHQRRGKELKPGFGTPPLTMEISGKYALADLSAELGVVMFICNTAVGKGIQANWLRVHGPLGTKAHLKWAKGVAEWNSCRVEWMPRRASAHAAT